MNQRIEKLAEQAGFPAKRAFSDLSDLYPRLDKFAQSIVYDFLSELTNDDSLGEARIATIQRLAEKWGVGK